MTTETARGRLPETFGARLSALFETTLRMPARAPWTNAALADAVTDLGVPTVQSYISQLRHGKRSNPSANLVGAIATAFGVQVAYFYDDQREGQFTDDELQTIAALRNAGVQQVALRAFGQLSPDGVQRLMDLAEYIRGIERGSGS